MHSIYKWSCCSKVVSYQTKTTYNRIINLFFSLLLSVVWVVLCESPISYIMGDLFISEYLLTLTSLIICWRYSRKRRLSAIPCRPLAARSITSNPRSINQCNINNSAPLISPISHNFQHLLLFYLIHLFFQTYHSILNNSKGHVSAPPIIMVSYLYLECL